jgi:transcriptional regulator with XRE-family HTH domain
MDERVVLCLNIVRLRREKGMSQEDLAFGAKRTRAYMSGLETGKRNPTFSTLQAIAKVLGTTVRNLLDEVPPETARALRQERSPRYRRSTGHRVTGPRAKARGPVTR